MKAPRSLGLVAAISASAFLPSCADNVPIPPPQDPIPATDSLRSILRLRDDRIRANLNPLPPITDPVNSEKLVKLARYVSRYQANPEGGSRLFRPGRGYEDVQLFLDEFEFQGVTYQVQVTDFDDGETVDSIAIKAFFPSGHQFEKYGTAFVFGSLSGDIEGAYTDPLEPEVNPELSGWIVHQAFDFYHRNSYEGRL